MEKASESTAMVSSKIDKKTGKIRVTNNILSFP